MTDGIADRPRVFLDISIGTEPVGRLIIVLFTAEAPKTCENFRSICAGTSNGLTYELSPFHRVIDEFMIQGGDITKGDGTGGTSIYGGEFDNENIGWRKIDEPGLVCMANRGRDTNSSQFFITLAPCEHLNAKHTVFGQLISGQDTMDRIAKVKVDKNDRPLTDVIVSHCGELQKPSKKNRGAIDAIQAEQDAPFLSRQSTTSRGRQKRRHVELQSRSRSRSPSRGHTRRSASRHRHHHRHRRQRADVHPNDTETNQRSSRSLTPAERHEQRRRSDAQIDHTKRGRRRQRSRSRSPSKHDDMEAHERKRSPEPSRPRSKSPVHRNQRSLPNQYRSQQQRQQQQSQRLPWNGSKSAYADGEDEEQRVARMEWERDGGDKRSRRKERNEHSDARLGRLHDAEFGHQLDSGGIVYKGRGAMKFRENQYH